MGKMTWPSRLDYKRQIDIDSLGRTLDENIFSCPFYERGRMDDGIARLVNFPLLYMDYDPCQDSLKR
jgi:hypothetical protein